MRSYLWVIPLALLWPVLQLLIASARFGPRDAAFIAESAIFLPMGAVSGAFLVYLWQRAASRRSRVGAVVGYVIATPVALIGSVLGGLMLPPLLGTLLFGAAPLLLGAAVGYALGARLHGSGAHTSTTLGTR